MNAASEPQDGVMASIIVTVIVMVPLLLSSSAFFPLGKGFLQKASTKRLFFHEKHGFTLQLPSSQLSMDTSLRKAYTEEWIRNTFAWGNVREGEKEDWILKNNHSHSNQFPQTTEFIASLHLFQKVYIVWVCPECKKKHLVFFHLFPSYLHIMYGGGGWYESLLSWKGFVSLQQLWESQQSEELLGACFEIKEANHGC